MKITISPKIFLVTFVTLVFVNTEARVRAANLIGGVAVDSSANVYTTGDSFGSGTGRDYATIKYNSSGTQQWASRYNGPAGTDDIAYAIAVDGSGNVYVTGSSGGSGTGLDYATVKYNSSGVQQWVARYNGPAGTDDIAYAIAVDGSGNVYVTGSSGGSGTSLDYATIKYNSSGTQQWVARYDSAGLNDTGYAIAVDASGNVYVTGSSGGSGTGLDYATIKYNSSGTQQWASRYNGPAGTDDIAYALAVDSSGNVYVTGSSGGSGTSLDYATIKYNSSGSQQWASRYNGPASTDDIAYALAVDSSGNVYATGSSGGSGSGLDYATVKYNSTGSQQWASRYNGPANSEDIAYALALDGLGNILVTGSSTGSGTGRDCATVKYNSSGSQQWASTYNGPGNADDKANTLALDSSNNVYVAGSSLGSGSGLDYATVKYNSSGTQQWASRYNGPGNSDDVASIRRTEFTMTVVAIVAKP
jgi:uncharacterized delta-60 repeat protein